MCGDDAGAAWLLLQKKPDLTDKQVRLTAKKIGERDLTGRTPMSAIAADYYRHSDDTRSAPWSESADRAVTLSPIARDLLGDVADMLSAGQTHEDIAMTLGVSRTAVTMRVSRTAEKISQIACDILT